MRQYNSTHKKKVKFYGFDVRGAGVSAKAIYHYLRKIKGMNDYDALLSTIMNPWTTARVLKEGLKDGTIRVKEQVENLIRYLEGLEPKLNRKTLSEQKTLGYKKWSLMVQHARVLLQYVEFRRLLSNRTKATDFRDKYMAENVRWLMDYERGAKIIHPVTWHGKPLKWA